MEHRTIVDKDGFIVSVCEQYENGKVLTLELKEGQQAVELVTNKTQVINGKNLEYVKPQWNGTEWVETATREELNEAYPVIKTEPTQEEILRANLLKDNVAFKLQLAQQQKINANLLTQIAKLGGTQ